MAACEGSASSDNLPSRLSLRASGVLGDIQPLDFTNPDDAGGLTHIVCASVPAAEQVCHTCRLCHEHIDALLQENTMLSLLMGK